MMDDDHANNELVKLSEFLAPVEASLTRAWLADKGIEASLEGSATANWLNYMGADLIGARLTVRQSDLVRAREVLEWLRAERAASRESHADDSPPTPPMIRACRAAIFGTFLLPPLLFDLFAGDCREAPSVGAPAGAIGN